MAVSAQDRRSAGGKAAANSAQARKEQQRLDNLAAFDEQVATGALVVREMTAAERQKWEARRAARTETEAASKAAALEHKRRRANRQRRGESVTDPGE
jgi:hypothetical protein